MCKYLMGGIEVNFPSVGYPELDQYVPTARTYLIGWRTDKPMENYALNCLFWAGNDRGFYQRQPLAVGSGDFPLYLVDIAEFCWLRHLEDMIRLLCGANYCCYSPFERARKEWMIASEHVDESIAAAIERRVCREAIKKMLGKEDAA